MKSAKLSAVLILLLACVPCTTVLAQQTSLSPGRDPQANALLLKAIAAMGGSSAAQIATQINDSVTEATIRWQQNPAAPAITTVIKTKGPDKIRIDNQSGGATQSVIHNQGRNLRSGGAGWTQGPSANSMHKRPEHLPVLLLAYELARGDLSAEYAGLESVGDQPAHHIRLARVSNRGNDLDVQLTKNSQLDLFIDPQSLQVLKISYLHFSENDWRVGWLMEIYYSDYRNVSGILIPFNQRTVFNGNPMSVLTVTRVAFNQDQPNSDFEGR